MIHMRNLKLLLKSIDYEGFQGSLLCKKKKRKKRIGIHIDSNEFVKC